MAHIQNKSGGKLDISKQLLDDTFLSSGDTELHQDENWIARIANGSTSIEEEFPEANFREQVLAVSSEQGFLSLLRDLESETQDISFKNLQRTNREALRQQTPSSHKKRTTE